MCDRVISTALYTLQLYTVVLQYSTIYAPYHLPPTTYKHNRYYEYVHSGSILPFGLGVWVWPLDTLILWPLAWPHGRLFQFFQSKFDFNFDFIDFDFGKKDECCDHDVVDRRRGGRGGRGGQLCGSEGTA